MVKIISKIESLFSQESADDVDNVEPQSENSESGISGYRIYSPSQKRRTMINELPEFYPDFPEDNFLCLTQYKYTKFILHKQTLTHKNGFVLQFLK